MKKPYCLDLDGGVYSLGDLNMMVYNKDTVDYPPADPQDPAKPFFTGAIRQEVTVGGETRPFLVYIPSRFPISGAGLFLYPEDGVSCGECLRSDCWQDLAEEFQVALVILESRKGGWSREDIQSEVSYSEAVFKKAISRVYFSLNEATYYIMGLGAGAYMAAAHGLLSSSLFSCILADGDYRLAPELLEQLGRIRSDRDPLCSKLEVVMPAWLASRSGRGPGAGLPPAGEPDGGPGPAGWRNAGFPAGCPPLAEQPGRAAHLRGAVHPRLRGSPAFRRGAPPGDAGLRPALQAVALHRKRLLPARPEGR